jgi:hypothetical protein
MKRGCLTTLVVLALCIGILVVGYRYKYPDYRYRYRLTVNIEADGKIYSGSSVIEVKWRGGPVVGDGGPFGPSVKGQAALVDLGDRGVVVATLLNDEDYGPAKDGALGALWWPLRRLEITARRRRYRACPICAVSETLH